MAQIKGVFRAVKNAIDHRGKLIDHWHKVVLNTTVLTCGEYVIGKNRQMVDSEWFFDDQ
jgi:hypothetical protein